MGDLVVDVGDRFPVEELAARMGRRELAGPIAVYFYPQARTPGCTIEAQRFNELYDEFRTAGTDVVGVSVDEAPENAGFAEECGLRFVLVSDSDRALTTRLGLIKDYGQYGVMAARVTFLLDRSGVIRRIWPVSDVQTHAQEVLDAARVLVEEEATPAETH